MILRSGCIATLPRDVNFQWQEILSSAVLLLESRIQAVSFYLLHVNVTHASTQNVHFHFVKHLRSENPKSWRAHWENLNTFFCYPPDIRNAIYTTNAIESLNSVIRAAIKKRKVFPTDDAVRKVIYLAIKDASKKWSMPIQNWRLAMSRFIIEFGDRLSDHL